jgi:hypothetical protein
MRKLTRPAAPSTDKEQTAEQKVKRVQDLLAKDGQSS